MGNIYGVDGTSGDINTIGSITAAGGIVSTSTTAGFLPPQLTTTQRNAIISPVTGLEVFNTTTNQPEFYNGSAWVAVGNGSGVTSLNSLTGALSIVGTSNEIVVTPLGTSITLSTPQAIGTGSSVTFAHLALSGLTNSTVVVTDGADNLVSSSTTTIELGYVHGVTSSIQTQFNNITGSIVTSITGTANEVIASASTGAVTLSLPQAIATTSTPTFGGLTVNSAFITIGSTSPGITGASSYSIVSSGVLQLAAADIALQGVVDVTGHKITDMGAATISGDALSYGQSSWSLGSGSLTGALAMGANKITGLANGTVSTDAAAFGQIAANGTVNSGTSTHLAYYATTGTAVSDASGQTISGTYTFSGGSGAITLSGSSILNSLGNSTAPSYAFVGETNVGMFSTGTNNLSFSIGGTVSFDMSNAAAAFIVPLTMNSNKIINLANGTASTDAAAYGQILPITGGTLNGNLAFTTTSTEGIVGTTTNDSAASGNVGEYISSSVTTPLSDPNATTQWFDVTSISLTAGDWDVTWLASGTPNGATVTHTLAGIGTASGTATTGMIEGINLFEGPPPTSVYDVLITIANYRVSISSTTTYYAKMRFDFSTGTPKAYGTISARRMR
jgi:hypothetical protein